MNQLRAKLKLYSLILFFLVALFVVLAIIALYLFIEYLSTPVEQYNRFENQPAHTILDHSSQFETLWESSENLLHSLVIADNHIFAVKNEYYDTPPGRGMIFTKLDIDTGEQIWEEKADYFGRVLHNSSHIFVERNNGEVVAYNLQDVNTAWVHDFSPRQNVRSISLSENHLIVHVSQDKTVIFEADSGSPFLDESLSTYSKLLYFDEDISYFYISNFSLVAYDHKTEVERWRHSPNGFEGDPFFDGDRIYVRTFQGQIQALNTNSGDILWETKRPTSLIDAERVVSNFAVTEKYLFYLTQDAQLKVLDKFTGERIGWINFSNSFFLLGDDIANYYFEVAADTNYVTVFLADSWQLFVFRFAE